jgi:hypothetical protein
MICIDVSMEKWWFPIRNHMQHYQRVGEVGSMFNHQPMCALTIHTYTHARTINSSSSWSWCQLGSRTSRNRSPVGQTSCQTIQVKNKSAKNRASFGKLPMPSLSSYLRCSALHFYRKITKPRLVAVIELSNMLPDCCAPSTGSCFCTFTIHGSGFFSCLWPLSPSWNRLRWRKCNIVQCI